MEINMLKKLYNDFLIILDQSVIKYKALADDKETVEMKKAADAFRVASLCEDTFNTYYHYDKRVLLEVMNLHPVKDADLLEEYYLNKNTIPFEYRDKVLRAQRKLIIEEYEERNNYYRMLNGLPDYEEDEVNFIYVDPSICAKYGIDPETPIHLLPNSKISVLYSIGYIDQLLSTTKKKYLKYLGENKIDILTARIAKNFAVLKIPYSISETMWDNFALIYEQCREYFCSCIYITEYRQTIDYYDNFIAMCIMIMTIQQVIARVLRNIVDRDFFDDYCVRILFGAYDVPYYSYMDDSTKTQLIQSLNLLILNKGTNKVLYDISKILGYDRLKIYKYYLMKAQKFDSEGMPEVFYTTDPDTGEEVLDYEKMYDYYFQKVELQDMDTYKSLLVTSNKKSYEEITSNDPFWIEDDDLLKEMYESEYNFVETKYMGISISYRLTRILFENVYLIKMIFDKKEELPMVTLDLPKLSAKPVTLFDAVLILCAIVCKQNGLRGEILTTPSKILHVIGFNFQDDFEKIRQEILSNEYLDDSLAKFFEDQTAFTASRVNALYNDLYALYDILVEKMSTTQSIEVYDAYRKLYDTIFYTQDAKWMFNIGTVDNPVYPDTFLEYLEHELPDIYEIIDNTSSDNLYELVNHICIKILTIIPNLKYLGLMAGQSETLEAMLLALIRFFKSYTTDIIGLEVLYIFDMKPELILRLIDELHYTKDIGLNEQWLLQYSDHISFLSTVGYGEKIKLFDKLRKLHALITLYERFPTIQIFNDEIHYIHANLGLGETNFNLHDVIGKLSNSLVIKDRSFIKDMIGLVHDTLTLNIHLSFEEALQCHIEILINLLFSLYDTASIDSILGLYEKIKLTDIYSSYITLQMNEKMSMSEYAIIYMKEFMNSQLPLYDIPNIKSTIVAKDNMKPMLRDSYKIIYLN